MRRHRFRCPRLLLSPFGRFLLRRCHNVEYGIASYQDLSQVPGKFTVDVFFGTVQLDIHVGICRYEGSNVNEAAEFEFNPDEASDQVLEKGFGIDNKGRLGKNVSVLTYMRN